MPALFLQRHWKKELQVFYRNFSILQKGSDTEAIHDLRVSIKKLRSYNRAFSAIFLNNGESIFPPAVNNIFSVLGRQRNFEISIELGRRLTSKQNIEGFDQYLKRDLQETEKRSAFALQHFNSDELKVLTLKIDAAVAMADEDIAKGLLAKRIRSSVHATKAHAKHFDKEYHLLRKKLKDIYYWTQIIPGDWYFSKESSKMIKSTLDNLGRAQDHEILLAHLKHYRRTIVGKGTEEYVLLKRVEGITADKKKELLHKAEEIVDAILAKDKRSKRVQQVG